MFTGVFRAPAPHPIPSNLVREKTAQLFAHKLLRKYVFTPQVAVGPYVVDYLCSEAGLIIQLPHRGVQSTDQQARAEFLARMGYRTVNISIRDLSQPGRLALQISKALGK